MSGKAAQDGLSLLVQRRNAVLAKPAIRRVRKGCGSQTKTVADKLSNRGSRARTPG